jgi:hypothetical protein
VVGDRGAQVPIKSGFLIPQSRAYEFLIFVAESAPDFCRGECAGRKTADNDHD